MANYLAISFFKHQIKFHHNQTIMKQPALKTIKIVCLAIVALSLYSCYSVRFVSVEGEEQPDPLSMRSDYYRDKMVVEFDTVVPVNIETGEIEFKILKNDSCKTGKLHTIEVKYPLAARIFGAITFRKKCRIKVKYVCQKETN